MDTPLSLAGVVLIIAGGPSVTADLIRLWNSGFLPDHVVSANEHGCFQSLYAVHYLVAITSAHARLKIGMAQFLGTFGRPIIAPFAWADHPLQDWRFRGDCGQSAIAVAAMHGAKRIVCTGLDGFGDGPRYFHEPRLQLTGRRDKMTFPLSLLQDELRALTDACRQCEVRPMSGYLTRLFPAYGT